MLDETELVSRILKGDLRAFEILVNQYQKLVSSIIARLVSNKEDVEDVCQEVFIKVHQSLPRFGFQSKLSTWIARIAYFTAINYIKKYNNRTYIKEIDNLENFKFTDESPADIAEKKNISLFVNRLINTMPAQYKLVLTLFHINEFSYLEIGEITGMPEGTIKGYLFRARKLLKEKIEKSI